jgi:transcriptional regulator with XRE-family HTH domain
MSDVSPALRQRELGLRLRKERADREMTVEEVAGKLLWSPEKIHRIETAARRATPRDVRDLCALYGVAGALADELMQLAGGPMEQDWWTQYEDLNLARFIELEQQASSIIQYTMHYVPALLQTEEYAHAIIKAVLPGIDPKIHANRVSGVSGYLGASTHRVLMH